MWYWLIPFADGRCSLGVVRRNRFSRRAITAAKRNDCRAWSRQTRRYDRLLAQARWDTPARQIVGYSGQCEIVVGPRLCAARQRRRISRSDFFFRSHDCFQIGEPGRGGAAAPIRRRIRRLATTNSPCRSSAASIPSAPLSSPGIAAAFSGSFFTPHPPPDIRRMISAILAGYAWDQTNPYVRDTKRRLAALEELCGER